jgi:hypothetical protein
MEFSKTEIQLKHLLKEMDRFYPTGEPIPFSIIAITCNYAKNDGGDIIVLENVIQAKNLAKVKSGLKINRLPTSSIDSVRPELANRIRRIYIPVSGQIRNVNLRYITHFKSQTDQAYKRIVY